MIGRAARAAFLVPACAGLALAWSGCAAPRAMPGEFHLERAWRYGNGAAHEVAVVDPAALEAFVRDALHRGHWTRSIVTYAPDLACCGREGSLVANGDQLVWNQDFEYTRPAEAGEIARFSALIGTSVADAAMNRPPASATAAASH